MTLLRSATIGAVALIALTATSEARPHHRHKAIDASGNTASGLVVSHKTGATARVGASHAAAFQAYIDDLESHGAQVRFMGGIRRGHCWSGGMHPCGKALDVCQLSRGQVDSRCHLPSRSAIASIATRHGLFEGGQWCSSDYGHAQVGTSAGACGERTLMARSHRRHNETEVAVAIPVTYSGPGSSTFH